VFRSARRILPGPGTSASNRSGSRHKSSSLCRCGRNGSPQPNETAHGTCLQRLLSPVLATKSILSTACCGPSDILQRSLGHRSAQGERRSIGMSRQYMQTAHSFRYLFHHGKIRFLQIHNCKAHHALTCAVESVLEEWIPQKKHMVVGHGNGRGNGSGYLLTPSVRFEDAS